MFSPEFWHWWMLAAVLLIVETLSPTFFTLWIAIAATITGFVLYMMPQIEWQYQVLLFAILSVVSIVAWRAYHIKKPVTSDQPLLNRRGEQYIGRIVTMDRPVIDGYGKVQIDDLIWKIKGEDCPAGTKVKIVGIDNIVLQTVIHH